MALLCLHSVRGRTREHRSEQTDNNSAGINRILDDSFTSKENKTDVIVIDVRRIETI